MTDGQIWAVMLRLKVFSPAMVLKELNPPPYLRGWIKSKIKNLIETQVKNGILRVVNKNPPFFATEDATKEDIERVKRVCPICGNRFFPAANGHEQEFCSPKCRQKHYKKYHEERRRKLGMKVGSKKAWTKNEIELLLRFRREGKTYREIADALGRTPEAVKDKLRRLKRKGVKL